jgi:hypothetical protein
MKPPLARLKKCLRCGEEFTPVSNRQAYCTTKCRRTTAVCRECGSTFTLSANSSGLYCSQVCWGSYQRKQRQKPCENCGRPFSNGSRATARFCSFECRVGGMKKERPVCVQCGTERVKHLKSKYCSRRCSMLARVNRNFGGPGGLPDGSRSPAGAGYVQIKVNGKWRLEHQHVMEQVLGRQLEKHERVHHKNGNRADNSPGNLELWKVKKKDPAGVRASDYHCAGCRCFD